MPSIEIHSCPSMNMCWLVVAESNCTPWRGKPIGELKARRRAPSHEDMEDTYCDLPVGQRDKSSGMGGTIFLPIARF